MQGIQKYKEGLLSQTQKWKKQRRLANYIFPHLLLLISSATGIVKDSSLKRVILLLFLYR
jgi:hypothetical protein